MGTKTTAINTIDPIRLAGELFLWQCVKIELETFGYESIELNVDGDPNESIRTDHLLAYRKLLTDEPVFITVHTKRMPFVLNLDRPDEIPTLCNPSNLYTPNPHSFRYANMGKEIKNHFIVTGGVNAGKSIVGDVLRKAIHSLAPNAVVHLIDNDHDCSTSVYRYKDAEDRDNHLRYVKGLTHTFGGYLL